MRFDTVVAVVALLFECVVLAGLFVRGKARSCWSFTAYIFAVALSDGLMLFWPGRFFRQDVWIFKESVLNLLKLGIALELMVRIFRHFPSAYASTRRAVIVVLALVVLLVGAALRRGTGYQDVVGRIHPHVNDGTVWLLVAVGGCSVWYHLPLDSLHKAILTGLIPFLLMYSVAQRAVLALGWERADVFNTSAPVAYTFLLAYWTYAVWRTRGGLDSGQRVSDLMKNRRG
jgi:hypothetical protein